MTIILVITMTIGGMDYVRREPVPDITTCFARAQEEMEAIIRNHPELDAAYAGCALDRGQGI